MKVFIIGCSIYSASICHILTHGKGTEVVGTAPTLADAELGLQSTDPDIIVVADTIVENTKAGLGALIIGHPCRTILRTSLDHDKVQVITSRCIDARLAELIAVIDGLTKRSDHV